MPSPIVYDLLQDPAGRIWFATRGGVASFDGTEWRAYGVAEGLASTAQGKLALDGRGGVWSAGGTLPWRVAFFDGERWHALPAAGSHARGGGRVVGLRVRHGVDGAQVLLALGNGLLLRWNGRRWERGGLGEGETRIHDVLFRRGRAFYATSNGLLQQAVFAGVEAARPVAGAPREVLLAVEADPAGGLWLVGQDWVGRLDEGRFEIKVRGLELGTREARAQVAAVADDRGGIYVADLHRLHYVSADGEVETFSESSGLTTGGASSLLIDREGLLWVGSLRGVSKLVSRRFANFNSSEGLLADEVTSILPLPGGEVLLGHMGGLTYWPSGRKVVLGRFGIDGRVLDLALADDGAVLAAANWFGLVRIAGEDFRRLELGKGDEAVVAVESAGDGWFWVATSRGLARWKRGRNLQRIELGGADLRVRALHRGPSGLWVMTTGKGLYLVRQGAPRRHWADPADSGGNSVFCVLDQGGGDALVGTAGGLYRTGAAELEAAPLAGRTIERPVYLLLEDTNSGLWIGTDSGCFRFPPRPPPAFRQQRRRDRRRGESHGGLGRFGRAGLDRDGSRPFDLPPRIGFDAADSAAAGSSPGRGRRPELVPAGRSDDPPRAGGASTGLPLSRGVLSRRAQGQVSYLARGLRSGLAAGPFDSTSGTDLYLPATGELSPPRAGHRRGRDSQ
ncbi:MAG: two-component regulator propeller domain-containing protein [Acidobacteriota bacterium]|nr:two-component regulator propeller domain-containing protein [Acidobacteriota bacterium]